MSNAYNTPAYRDYIADYSAGLPLVEVETEEFSVHGLRATMTTRHYETERVAGHLPDGTPTFYLASRETAELTITDRVGGVHSFAITDVPLFPIPLTIGGRDLILLRRNLYGYTLLDTNDLSHPLLDYFPSAVLDGEEAFIVCDAHPLGNLIVLAGCYWACSWLDIFVLDPTTGRTLHLNKAAGFADIVDGSLTTTPDALTFLALTKDGVETPRTISPSDIRTFLAEEGQFDL